MSDKIHIAVDPAKGKDSSVAVIVKESDEGILEVVAMKKISTERQLKHWTRFWTKKLAEQRK